MDNMDSEKITKEFCDFILDQSFPCVAARAAVKREHINVLVADHMACPKDDYTILQFIYRFIKNFRKATNTFHSAAIIFSAPETHSEELFDNLMWQRLQSLALLDRKNFSSDKRVSDDPNSPEFSFSLGEEAFFIIGMHPASSRPARKFKYPVLVFNPHAQFEEMRKNDLYDNMKNIVRQRDRKYAGSINPMLTDFGKTSEVYQYSGRQYSANWQCPLRIQHETSEHHSSEK